MLKITALRTEFDTGGGIVKAVRNVDISISAGEIVAIVGESGCGKSTLALSIMKLIDPNGRISGRVLFRDRDLLTMTDTEILGVRGRSISMIFQDPFSTLNPVLSIGDQLIETLMMHEKTGRNEARQRAMTLLEQVKMSDPAGCLNKYQHQFSGGMRQRIMIAMAIASKPELLIADEPATALDVITGAEILELILELRRKLGMSVMLITHNIAFASKYADRFYVMYAGEVMEQGDRADIIRNSKNPYTYMLLKCLPEKYGKGEELRTISGAPPDMRMSFGGCAFAARCGYVKEICGNKRPELVKVSDKHLSRCLRIKEIAFNE